MTHNTIGSLRFLSLKYADCSLTSKWQSKFKVSTYWCRFRLLHWCVTVTTLQHAATRCNTLLHAAASVDIIGALVRVSHATATHCNTLQYAATNFSKYNMAEFSNDFRCILWGSVSLTICGVSFANDLCLFCKQSVASASPPQCIVISHVSFATCLHTNVVSN